MAQTTVSTNNIVTKFKRDFAKEYVREGRFNPYIGNNENSVIQVNRSLQKVSIPLITKLKGQGVVGTQTLSGNEEALDNYEYKLIPTYRRNAVKVNDEDREKSEFDLLTAAKATLKPWAMESKRDRIIQALGGVQASGTYYNYGGTVGATDATAASAANMDTWQAANTDRILYGELKSNLTSGDHTTSLGTIDTTNDKLDTDMVSLLKRMAENCDPLIRPVMIKGDEPWFVLFVGSYSFRDLKISMQTFQKDALERGEKNPLFQGGDLIWDGVVIKKIPEIDKFIDSTGAGAFDGVWGARATGDSLKTSGNGGSRVGIGFLCGAQAVGFGLGRDVEMTVGDQTDYGFNHGVGVAIKDDFRKTFFNGKQHGMVTSFHSSSVDA